MRELNVGFCVIKVDDEDYDFLLSVKDKIVYSKGHIRVKQKGKDPYLLAKYLIDEDLSSLKKMNYIDEDISNLQKANLVTRGYKTKNCTSKYLGVSNSARDGRYYCYVRGLDTSKAFYLGRYDTEIEAAIAYNKGLDMLKELYKQQGLRFNYKPNVLELCDSEYMYLYDKVKVELESRHTNQGIKAWNKTTSTYIGVSKVYIGHKWRTRLTYKGKIIQIGHFSNEIQAAKAYNEAVFLLYGSRGIYNDTVDFTLGEFIDISTVLNRVYKSCGV
ncbi:AP2 domain protein [compost metagenome]